MARVILVERALLTAEQTAQLAKCLAVRECVLVQTYRGESREVAVYEARDTERVRDSHRSAGIPFERAWAAEIGSDPSS